jgi:hypothetical protein
VQRKRDLLEVLKTELQFLEEGGYRYPFRNDWRAQFIFEDSPTCLNYNAPAKDFVPCSNCPLMGLIPAEKRSAKWPCRQIPLNGAGETLESLYRSADAAEIEIVVRRWLRAQIQRLESQKGPVTAAATPGE